MLDLWSHQREMAEFCAGKNRVILDCGMGGGKTGTAAHVVSELWSCNLVLIFAPKKVVESPAPWAKDLRDGRFANREWHVERLHKGSTPTRVKRLKEVGMEWRKGGEKYGLCFVVNYEAVLNDQMLKTLRSVSWDAVILDECHRIRGRKAKGSKKVSLVCAGSPRVMGLSGTLMPNSPMDLWAIMRAVNPEVFGGSFVRFRNQYGILGGFRGKEIVAYRNTDEMMERCKETIVRFTEDDLDLGLQESIDEQIELTMCPAGAKAYSQVEAYMVAAVEEGVCTASNALVRIIRLMQITGGTLVIEKEDFLGETEKQNHEIDTTKRDYVREMVEDTDAPVVVFALFRVDMDNIHYAVELAGSTSMEVSGARNDLEDWKAGGAQVLVVQIGAGAEGIDLTRAHIAVFYSTGYDLGKYLQARKRLDRPGQKRAVIFRHLVVKDSIDERVCLALAKKEEVVTSVLDQLKDASVQLGEAR